MNSLKRVYQWFHKLPKQIQDSIFFSVSVVGFFSTIFTVLGASLKDLSDNLWIRIGIIILSTIILAFGYYIVVGNVYKDSVALSIAKTPVEISCGDILRLQDIK